MARHGVVIAGGGPTGMMLGAELALAGVDAVVIEKRETPDVVGSRAGGLHARTIEMLDQRGIAERFLQAGYTAQVARFADAPLDISDFPSRHPYGLALWQKEFERILAGWVDELGVRIVRGREVTGFAEDEAGIAVTLDDGAVLRAQYLVGCDGGRSLVRKAAGIDFPGWDPTISNLLAEVHFAEEPPFGIHEDQFGIHGFGKLEGGLVRVMVTEGTVTRGEATLAELSAALVAVCGTDYGVHSPASLGRFTDMARQAATYRKGRVLLAGDAAHVHYPVGGQGLNLGLQDAVNLGWKLAQVVKGVSPSELLDSYGAERHPVAARVLRDTMAQVALRRPDARSKAAQQAVAELVALEGARKQLGGVMSGLGIHYDLGAGHPLLGRRMPDLDIATAEGPMRVYALLHRARPVLLDFGTALDVGAWADRVPLVAARYDGAWELPVIGTVEAPGAVLVRPDGYVCWVGDGSDAGLTGALTRWFGPAPEA